MRHCHCPVVISATPAATHNCCPRLDLNSTMSRKLKIYIQNCEWHTRLSSSRDRDTQNNSAIIFGEPACVGKVELRNHNNPECWEAAGLFLPGLCDVRVAHWVAKADRRPREKKKFYHHFSIVKYSYLPTDTFRKYVEMHVTRSKLTLKFPGYCRH